MLPSELITAIAKEWGGYGVMFVFAGYFLYKYLTDATTRKQKRLDEQQAYVDSNWNKIREEKDARIKDLETEIIEIRTGHRARLQEMSDMIHNKRQEIDRLNGLLEESRRDNQNGWDRGRGSIKGWRISYHGRNNDRQVVESLLRLNGIDLKIPWSENIEPPDLEDVEPVKG